MKFIIYGTGGVGGYFGTRLAQSGQDVTFIARGKHLEAIQKHGLQLKSVNGDHTVFPAQATDDITSISDPDVVIFTTKTWQLQEAAQTVLPIVSKKTLVVSLLNGVTNTDVLLSVFPKEQVLGGFCKIFSKIEDHGIINHAAMEPYVAFGELDNSRSNRVLQLYEVFKKAAVHVEVPKDIHHAIWSKFLFITTISALGALTRATVGEMLETPEVKDLLESIAREVLQIANAKGVQMDETDFEKVFQFINRVPYNSTASLQRDVMEGRPSELESQVGTIHKFGKEFEVPTPVSSFVYHSLLIQEQKNRQKS